MVRVPAEQTLGDYLNSGWMKGVEKASIEDITINGFPAMLVAAADGDQWQFKGPCAALRQRRLPLHLRGEAEDHRERAQRAGDRQLVPPPDAGGVPRLPRLLRIKVITASSPVTPWIRYRTAWPASTTPPSASAC